MNKGLLSIFLFLLLGQVSFSQAPASVVPNQVILSLTTSSWQGRSLPPSLQALGLELVRSIPAQGLYLCRMESPGPQDQSFIDQLERLPEVQTARYNHLLEERNLEPNDPFFANQWGMDLVQAPRVWDYSTGGLTANGDTLVIGVLDSGFDIEHPELAENLWTNWAEKNGLPGVDDDQNGYVDDVYGYNFAQNKPEHADGTHGNPVTGILGARGNNEEGVTGVNWQVKIIPMTVFTDFDIVEAYQYVLDLRQLYQATNGAEGALVVSTNASLGISNRFCAEFPNWGAMYDPLGAVGILSVAATTNEEQDVEEVGDMPTTCPSEYLIAVTNTDRDDAKVSKAGFGAKSIDLGAPGGPFGDGTYTIQTGGGYDTSFGGTSAACPHVAGAIALLYSLPSDRLAADLLNQPEATALLMREAILAGVDQLPTLQGNTTSGGRLNIFQSMLYLHAYYQDFQIENFYKAYTQSKNFVGVYPNPVSVGVPLRVAFGTFDLNPVTIELYSSTGKFIFREEVEVTLFENQEWIFDTNNLVRGVYTLVIQNGPSTHGYKVIVL